jgi:diguanylate cyclase (GGDEF)-like protein
MFMRTMIPSEPAIKEYVLARGVKKMQETLREQPVSGLELQYEVARLREQCDKLVKEKQVLEKLVYVDELTSLYNLRSLKKRLEQELNRAKRHGRDFSLIMIDIDNLKQINDLYGYNMGNQVILEISKCLKATLRNIDIISRSGGDEFVIILPDTSERHALHVAQRLTESLESLSFREVEKGSEFKVSVSGAIVFLIDRECTAEDLFRQADQLLYQAKRQGKNCINFVMSEEFLEKPLCVVKQAYIRNEQ